MSNDIEIQLELILGPKPSADDLDDFFKTEDQLNSNSSHLSSTNHHPLIKKPFRFNLDYIEYTSLRNPPKKKQSSL